MDPEDHEIEFDGLRVRYWAGGQGPALVLLHGAWESRADWQWVLPSLARHYVVYAPDLPGFGDSSKPPCEYSPAFYQHVLARFLETLHIGRATVVAHSLAGLPAIRYALAVPERLNGLILVASAGLGREVHPALCSMTLPGWGEVTTLWGRMPLGSLQRAWIRAGVLFAQRERAPRAWLLEQYRLALLPGVLEAGIAALRSVVDVGGQREVILDELSRLRVPVHVVWGEDDAIFPVDHARQAVRVLPKSELTVIPDCGHLPHIEHPTRFIEVLTLWLTRLNWGGVPRY
jgi:pimeloyl-ACP methyl ester carboxylesterase